MFEHWSMLSIVRLLSLVELYSNRLIYEQEYVRVRCLNRFHHLFCVAFSIFIVESKEKKQQQPKHTLLYISSPTLLIGSFVERIISSISLRSFSFLFIIEHSSFDYINSIEHFHFLFFLSLATFVFFFLFFSDHAICFIFWSIFTKNFIVQTIESSTFGTGKFPRISLHQHVALRLLIISLSNRHH